MKRRPPSDLAILDEKGYAIFEFANSACQLDYCAKTMIGYKQIKIEFS